MMVVKRHSEQHLTGAEVAAELKSLVVTYGSEAARHAGMDGTYTGTYQSLVSRKIREFRKRVAPRIDEFAQRAGMSVYALRTAESYRLPSTNTKTFRRILVGFGISGSDIEMLLKLYYPERYKDEIANSLRPFRDNQVSIETKEKIGGAVVDILRMGTTEERKLEFLTDKLALLDGEIGGTRTAFLKSLYCLRDHNKINIEKIIQPEMLNRLINTNMGLGAKRSELLAEVFDYLRENINFEAIENPNSLRTELSIPETRTDSVTTETSMMTTPRWRAETAKAELERLGIDLNRVPSLKEMFREI